MKRQRLGSISLLMLVSCSRPSAAASTGVTSPANSVPPVTAVEPKRDGSEMAPIALGATSKTDAPLSATGSGAPAQTEPVGETVSVSMEAMSRPGSRPRPQGAVAAAVADEELQVWNYGGRGDPSHVSNRPGYHPGTRVVVDATPRLSRRALNSRGGRLLAQRLVAGLRNRGYWPFRLCFEDAARQAPESGGRTNLSITVNAAGRVTFARLERSAIKNRGYRDCLVRALRGIQLDNPPGRRVDAAVVVSTWAGDLPVLSLPVAWTSEDRTRSAVDDALRAQKEAFVPCFVSARAQDPRLWGRLALAFVVGDDGHPTQIQERESQFGSAAAVRCVAEQLARLVLPQSEQRTPMQLALRLERPPDQPPSATVSPDEDGEAREPSSGIGKAGPLEP